ncbi:GNAT family N-acetyltransferase [Alkalibacillus haloalkaliphilus]|uniref:N-acetyltransferase n=1 Tax=Alkalibacillus haloalkaliphilus TaxID=94136 RepID=A0A511W5J7_9BACI|nr:GNAT family N-acetyltransferase [Alkalibacillus haloalkaliphilus]GEN45568.1 N-acetyltransferase [Alkalibacillus haloalkaliphilus]
MDAVIRPLEQSDIRAVQQVAQESWHHTYEGVIPRHIQDTFLTEAYSDLNMQRRLDRGGVWVAENQDGIVGFANLTPINDHNEAELVAIYILPDHIGFGIGTKLLQSGVSELKGLQRLYVEVEKENEVGLKFYEAKGFNVLKEYDDVFAGHTLKTLQMVKDYEEV